MTTVLSLLNSILRRDNKDNGEAKPSKHEVRRAEAAIKKQKMLEEQRREKEKVKDRLDLIRQMKGKRCTFTRVFGISSHAAVSFLLGCSLRRVVEVERRPSEGTRGLPANLTRYGKTSCDVQRTMRSECRGPFLSAFFGQC